VRRGKGQMQGQVAWIGSPLSLDYASLSGAFKVNMEGGQFLKADPGLAKLLGVLSLQALPRRLTLDFRDVFSEGFAFDFVRGDVTIVNGIASTNNLQMKGVNAAVLMEGKADIAREAYRLGLDTGISWSCYDPQPDGRGSQGGGRRSRRVRGMDARIRQPADRRPWRFVPDDLRQQRRAAETRRRQRSRRRHRGNRGQQRWQPGIRAIL